MVDISVFIKSGWKIIWKQRIIWLFSAILSFGHLILSFQNKQTNWLASILFVSVVLFLYISLSLVSVIGVPYIAYNFSAGKFVTIPEVLFAARKYLWRVIGLSCIGVILSTPLLFGVLFISGNNAMRTFQISDKAALLLIPLSLFNALWYFTLFGFFANNWSVWQSIKNAWALFTARFSILATLGITLAIISTAYDIVIKILTTLTQSGFNVTSLIAINYFPSMYASKNTLVMLLNGIGGVIFTTFTVSVFALAYLKYSKAKTPSVSSQR